MADHYVSINRGKTGQKMSEFTAGASATTADDLEIRIADAAGWTRLEIIQALEALELYHENTATFPVL